jgi:hypothetical protein
MAVDARSVAALAPGHQLPELAKDPYLQATAIIVHLAVVVVGLDFGIGAATSATLPLAMVLGPLWIGAIRKYTLAPLITCLMAACVFSGLVLTMSAAQDHRVSIAGRNQMLGLLLSGAAAFVLILWARLEMPLYRVVALYGFGGVVGAVLDGRMSWKFGVALPATFLILGLLERSGLRVRCVVATMALGLFGVMDDYRSYFAFCLLAATLTVWQMRPALGDGRPPNRWWPAILIAGAAIAMYLLTSTLITAGYLGEDVQVRSEEQIERSGSLLAGGRPEWAATLELMRLKPSGYGVGVIPNLEDIHVAKRGLDSINIGLNPERDRYMFGTEFRLHSIVADLWVRYGVIGLALAGAILVGVVRSLSFRLAERAAPTSIILASLLALWSLPFEPSYTYWVRVCVALGLVLVPRGASRISSSAEQADAGRGGGMDWRSDEHSLR